MASKGVLSGGYGSFFEKRTVNVTSKAYVLLELELGKGSSRVYYNMCWVQVISTSRILLVSSEHEKCGITVLKSQ